MSALITLNYYSNILERDETVVVVYPTTLPPRAFSEYLMTPGIKLQTLWLLHGENGNCREWETNACIDSMADEFCLVMVMPNIQPQFADEGLYERYLKEELPAVIGEYFTVSYSRENNYIAGMNSGGSLALSLCLRHPESYGAVGCFGKMRITAEDAAEIAACSARGSQFPYLFHSAGDDADSRSAGNALRECLSKTDYLYTSTEEHRPEDYEFYSRHLHGFLSLNQAVRKAPVYPDGYRRNAPWQE